MKASRVYKYKINKKGIFKHQITNGKVFWDSKTQGTYKRGK